MHNNFYEQNTNVSLVTKSTAQDALWDHCYKRIENVFDVTHNDAQDAY